MFSIIRKFGFAMVDTHVAKGEAVKAFQERFDQVVVESDRFLAVIWSIKDGKLILDRTSFDFPMGDYGKSLELLKRNLVADTGLDFSPLPEAMDVPGLKIVADAADEVG